MSNKESLTYICNDQLNKFLQLTTHYMVCVTHPLGDSMKHFATHLILPFYQML